VRLFEELCAGIRMEIDGKDVGLEEALTQLHEPDREVRRRASAAITGALQHDIRTRAYVFNVTLQDKAIDDRLRHFSTWVSSREKPQPDYDAVLSEAKQVAAGG